MRGRGLEPPRPCGRYHLKVVRLPFRHPRILNISILSDKNKISILCYVFILLNIIIFTRFLTLFMNKEQIRNEALKLRTELPFEERKSNNSEIVKNILLLKEFKSTKNVLLYASIKNEADISEILDKGLKPPKDFSLPKILDKKIYAYQVNSFSELIPGKYKIPEPPIGTDLTDKIDLVFVPGVAFDLNGNRIGYGKGYYDKFLLQRNFFKVGVCYECQIINNIIAEPHDIRMNCIITEKNIYYLK